MSNQPNHSARRIIRGTILLEGQAVLKLGKEKTRDLRGRRISYVFQDPMTSLNPVERIKDHFVELIRTHKPKVTKAEAITRAKKLFKDVGIQPERINLYPYQLSGGQRQRIAMARSLILRPEFIVVDEPVSMIDVSLRTTIIDLMLDLRKELELTYLFITHDLAIAKYISDRVAVMYLGKIVEMGSKQEIFTNPTHPYTQALLSAIPVPTPERKKKTLELKGEVSSAINIPPGCRFNPRCSYTTDKCKKTEPYLIETTKGHFVACYKAEA